jgi:hypothetical protein
MIGLGKRLDSFVVALNRKKGMEKVVFREEHAVRTYRPIARRVWSILMLDALGVRAKRPVKRNRLCEQVFAMRRRTFAVHL